MKIKNYLLSTAAAVMAFGVHATAPVAASAADVKACDLYGSGFYYLPGTETCLGVSGRVRVHYNSSSTDTTVTTPGTGGGAVTTSADEAVLNTNGRIQFDVRNESDIGTIRGVLRISESDNIDAGRIHVGDHLTFGKHDAFFTRHNGYGHLVGNFDGPYPFYEARYAEFHGSAGPLAFTVGVEDDRDNSDSNDSMTDQSTGNADEPNFYAGVKYNHDLGAIAVHYLNQDHVDDSVIGVAVDLNVIDNLSLKGWYHTEDEGTGDIVDGDNDTQWGIGGSYALGDWSVGVGYGFSTGGQERAAATDMAALDPDITALTVELGWKIASGLKAEFAWETQEGGTNAVEGTSANSTQADRDRFRVRLIRSW